MTTRFDRLERFFNTYKRKGSLPVGSGEPISPVTAVPSEIEQQFPSPSFIRPKASRMCARDEVRLRDATDRSPSVPDIILSSRFTRCHSRNQGSTGSSATSTKRSLPSANSRQNDPLMASFRDFQFPKPPSNGEISPSSLTFSPKHSSEAHRIPSPRSCSPLRLTIPTRIDTPPSSDPEDNNSPYAVMRNKKLPSIPGRLPPTPGESPELGPVPERLLRSCKSADNLETNLFSDIRFDMDQSLNTSPLRKSFSQSSLRESARLSCTSSTLREPDVSEFLSLSDDDIAEDTASESIDFASFDGPHSELPGMGLSFAQKPLASSLLTLTPPRASQPATAAAFEAARIAKRYDFDLVYVVNLWPGSSVDSDDQHGVVGERPLIGRLLAAHGLHHVPSPLQISSLVHTTILRSDGWIEYRNPDARGYDLARGYAAAFYTGQYSRQGCKDITSPVSGVRLSEQIDRGIVFAAYRKPRAGEERLGRTFTETELGELHKEAEVLVEMLIDIHVASRLRNPPAVHPATDETGPMPEQTLL